VDPPEEEPPLEEEVAAPKKTKAKVKAAGKKVK
jgi:hypothetical protein